MDITRIHIQLPGVLLLLGTGIAAAYDELLFPSPKVWWAKKVTSDLYTAGRLTETQIKYAAEAGFKSLISMFREPRNITMGDQTLPDYPTERYIATELGGMYYNTVLRPGETWMSVNTTYRLTDILLVAPKPVLFHCVTAYSATFHAFGHLAHMTVVNPNFPTRINTTGLYERASILGYDFWELEKLRGITSAITGEAIPKESSVPRPVITIPGWNSGCWLMKPVYKNWFIAGQVERDYLENIKEIGVDVIVNTRLGLTNKGNKSQEEVTLLNVADDTGTYDYGGRQSEDRLLETRLNKSLPSLYVDWFSEQNYQSKNVLEFGDDVGYNEDKMHDFVTEIFSSDGYLHTPFETGAIENIWAAYGGNWKAITSNVLVTSQDGTRAVIVAVLAAGYKNEMSADWAMQRAEDLGYTLGKDVEDLFQKILTRNSTDTSASSCNAPYTSILFVTLVVVHFTFNI